MTRTASPRAANYNDAFEQAVAEVFKGYAQRLRQANAMDFDDLIAETVYMFRAFPALAGSVRAPFRYVLVDDTRIPTMPSTPWSARSSAKAPAVADLTVWGTPTRR